MFGVSTVIPTISTCGGSLVHRLVLALKSIFAASVAAHYGKANGAEAYNGFNRTPVSSAAAKPGQLGGGAG